MCKSHVCVISTDELLGETRMLHIELYLMQKCKKFSFTYDLLVILANLQADLKK